MLIVGGLLWFKVYGGELVGDKAQKCVLDVSFPVEEARLIFAEHVILGSDLLQTGVLAGTVLLVLSIGKHRSSC